MRRACDVFAHTQSLPGKSPLQRHIVAALRAYGPQTEQELKARLFPTHAPDARPRITAALGALMRGHVVKRVGSGLYTRYFTRA